MIRKLQKEDLGQVMRIWLDSNVDAHPFISKAYWESNFEMVKEQLVQAEAYVYEENGDIRGFVGLQEDYIAGIFVKSECRSHGIGKRLLEYVKSVKANMSLRVYQKNTRAIRFYQREQFVIRSENTDDSTNQKEYVMTWKK